MKYIVIWVTLTYTTTLNSNIYYFKYTNNSVYKYAPIDPEGDRHFKIIEGRKEAIHFYDSLKVISKGHFSESGAFVKERPLVQVDTILQLK